MNIGKQVIGALHQLLKIEWTRDEVANAYKVTFKFKGWAIEVTTDTYGIKKNMRRV